MAGLVFGTMLAGCISNNTNDPGPVQANTMNVIAGGVGQDVPARIFQEYGQDTTCRFARQGDVTVSPCPDDQGFPHQGPVCHNMKWSVQFANDHPYDGSEEKYGLPYNASLVYSLQQWREEKQELRFYWVRYSDTQCKFTDNDVIYCVELVSYSKADSKDHGCIRAMHRTFPGLDSSWMQGLDYAGPKGGQSAEATEGAATG